MKNSCKKCGRDTIGELCKGCSPKKFDFKKVERVEDFRRGLCHFVYHGEYCMLPGACTRDSGSHPVSQWYCTYHVNCSDPNKGREISTWGKKYFREILIARKFSLWNDTPFANRPVVAHAPPVTLVSAYEDYLKFCKNIDGFSSKQLAG